MESLSLNVFLRGLLVSLLAVAMCHSKDAGTDDDVDTSLLMDQPFPKTSVSLSLDNNEPDAGNTEYTETGRRSSSITNRRAASDPGRAHQSSPTSSESGSWPDDSSTYTGSTRQGQRVIVRKWNLSQNGHASKDEPRTGLSSAVNNHRARTPRSRSATASRSSSGTRTSTGRRSLSRTRHTSSGRTGSSVLNKPAQTSRTYYYPFTEKGHIATNSHARGYISNTNSRTRQPSYRPSNQRLPVYQGHGGERGSETLAQSSSSSSSSSSDTETGQHTAYHGQPSSQLETQASSHYQPQPRQTRYASNSSLATSLNRRSGSQRPSLGRVRNPNNRLTSSRTHSSRSQQSVPDGSSSRRSYRYNTGSSSGNSYRSNPGGYSRPDAPPISTQIFSPQNGQSQSNSQSSRGTRYSSVSTGFQRPYVQRTFRRAPVSPGYSRRYPQRGTSYSRGTSGSVYSSYDVADEGECPNTGIDLRINGLGCRQAVQHFGSYLCYMHEFSSTECCESCIRRKRIDKKGCEYGDHARLCNNISPSDCYDRRNELSCCETCARYKRTDVPEMCQWGDMIGRDRCDEVRRNPGLCYMPDNARLCCETCGRMKNESNPTCLWGDQNARMCKIFGPAGDVVLNCYSPYRKRLCCQSCQRLKEWLPKPMPSDCEYGDRPVVYNTRQYGRVNCGQLLNYVGGDVCRNNPEVAKNCCRSCRRYTTYFNSTSSAVSGY